MNNFVTTGLLAHLHAYKVYGVSPGKISPMTTTWADLSGNGNNGTLKNFSGTSISGWTKGYRDYDNLSFSNTGETLSLLSGTEQYTLSFWFKLNAYPTDSINIVTNSKLTVSMFSSINSGKCIMALWADSSGSQSSKSLDLGVWYHVIIDNFNKKIYVNSIDTSILYSSRWSLDSHPSLIFGKGFYNGGNYSIASIRVYNQGFTQDMVNQEYNAGLLYDNTQTLSNLKTKVSDMVVGDCIPCRYTAITSGKVGTFSELGTCTAAEIPVAGTTTPDGKFYFIMAGYDAQGKKKLVADRNIQTGISWDTLNSAGFCGGIKISNKTAITVDRVPVMTGPTTGGYTITGTGYLTNEDPWHGFISINSEWGAYAGGTALIDCGSPKTFNTLYVAPYYLPTFADVIELYAGNDVNNLSLIYTINKSDWSSTTEYIPFKFPSGIYRYYKIKYAHQSNMTNPSRGNFKLTLDNEVDQLQGSPEFKLLTGGISSSDTDNEWDKIICESNLGGTITPGDDNVWHWKNLWSWVSTTNPGGGSSTRTIRGNGAANLSSYVATSSTNSNFRPVMLVEDTSDPIVVTVTKFMLQQDTNIFDINPANYSTPPINISELHVVGPLTDTIIEQSGGEWDDVVNYLNLFKGTKYKILKLVRNQ